MLEILVRRRKFFDPTSAGERREAKGEQINLLAFAIFGTVFPPRVYRNLI
jgi:hypothetical protein